MKNLFSGLTRQDVAASLGVFVVAVPLSLGIALASGAPASAAIITAIVGGIVVGALAGAPLVISGPAAGLAALVFHYVQQFGLRGLAIITIGAGIVQLILGALRLGRVFTLVPQAVLGGMLAAIGAIITLGQVHVLFGSTVPPSTGEALLTMPSLIAKAFGGVDVLTIAALGLLAIAIQLVWPKLSPKVRWIPGALPAVAVVALFALPLEVPRVALESLGDAISQSLSLWSVSTWSLIELLPLAIPTIGLALVASAETLLTARAVDGLAQAKGLSSSKASLDRELIAQGVGNTVVGSLGGLPMTGVIVRSAANINFGATSKWSAILHGVWIALAVIAFPFAITIIPLTALAAVLIVTGFKLANPSQCLAAFRSSKVDGILWLTTFIGIMATDLLRGLAIALVAAVVLPMVARWFAGIAGTDATLESQKAEN